MRPISLLLPFLLLSAPAHAATYTVGIDGANLLYTPAMVNIQAGDRVVIAASALHPLHFDSDASFSCTANCSFLFTQEQAGYSFFCGNHGGAGGVGMSGSIMVQHSDDYIHADDFEQRLVPDFSPGL